MKWIKKDLNCVSKEGTGMVDKWGLKPCSSLRNDDKNDYRSVMCRP